LDFEFEEWRGKSMRKVLTPVLLGLLITVIATAGGGCKSTAGDTQTTTTTSTVSASPGIVDISVQEAERLIQITKDNPDFYISRYTYAG